MFVERGLFKLGFFFFWIIPDVSYLKCKRSQGSRIDEKTDERQPGYTWLSCVITKVRLEWSILQLWMEAGLRVSLF